MKNEKAWPFESKPRLKNEKDWPFESKPRLKSEKKMKSTGR